MHKERLDRHCKDNFPLSVVITDTDEKVPIHSHDFIELVFFAKGAATHSMYYGTKKLQYAVMQGDCFTVLPREKHSFEDGNPAFYYNVIFSPDLIANELSALQEFNSWNYFFGKSDFKDRKKVHLGLNERLEMSRYIERLRMEIDRRPKGYKICARAILVEILLLILRCTPKKMLLGVTSVKSNPDIINIINEMEKNPEKKYSLAALAKKSNMCVSGFTRKFRNMVGMSPIEYLLTLRMEKAENLLLSTSMTVYDIAEQCGFYDINYFIKVFRRLHEFTPAKFRKLNKSGGQNKN